MKLMIYTIFICRIDANSIYSVIPMISMKGDISKQCIVLSPSILLSRNS